MDFHALAKRSRKLAYEGKDYEAILKEINIDSLPEKMQKELRSLTDDFIVQYQLAAQVKEKHLTKIMLGGVLAFLGIFILLFTYIRQEGQYTIGFFALLVGTYIIKKGYDQYKQPIDFQDIAPKKSSIFNRY